MVRVERLIDRVVVDELEQPEVRPRQQVRDGTAETTGADHPELPLARS